MSERVAGGEGILSTTKGTTMRVEEQLHDTSTAGRSADIVDIQRARDWRLRQRLLFAELADSSDDGS